MTLSARIDSIINNVNSISSMKEEIASFADKETKVKDRNIGFEFGEQQEWYYRSVVKEKIDEFYADYNPNSYHRRFDLYDVYQPRFGKDGMVITDAPGYDDLYFTAVPFGRDGCSLFDLVFKHGYHGGAAGTDSNEKTRNSPHYRMPIPFYTMWDGRAEKMDPSPYELVKEELTNEEGGYVFDLFKQISKKHNDIFCEKVNNKIAEMMAARMRNI